MAQRGSLGMRRKTVGLRKWLPYHVCLVACLLLAATGLLAVFGQPLRDRLLASYYEHQLAADGNGADRELLARLMNLGRPGTTAAVRALGAPMPATRELAYRTLFEELNRVEEQASQERSGLRLSDMAQALAAHIQHVPDRERGRAQSLAMKIAALAEAVPLAERGVVIASCQHALAVREKKRRPARAVSLAPLRMAPVPRRRIAGKNPPPSSASHQKPSAQLNLTQFSPPALGRADAQAPAEPGLLTPNDAVALVGQPKKPQTVGRREEVMVAAFTSDADESRATEDAGRATREQAHQLDVIELFRHLHSGQPLDRAARAELDARGFSPRQIEVGEHLVSPDAAERLQWTEWLPGIRGVDARFWLLRLSHDPNGHVRRAAVGLLATDRDPEVVRRLQRVVVEDTDERIREQASRALEVLGEP